MKDGNLESVEWIKELPVKSFQFRLYKGQAFHFDENEKVYVRSCNDGAIYLVLNAGDGVDKSTSVFKFTKDQFQSFFQCIVDFAKE